MYASDALSGDDLWTCHAFLREQDDLWCQDAGIQSGFEYEFVGPSSTQCGSCASHCCKREALSADQLWKNRDLYHAGERGEIGRVMRLLGEGAQPNWRNPDDGMAPALMRAAAHGYAEVCKSLLAANASVDMADKYGRTALLLAAQQRQALVVTILIGWGADVNRVNKHGDTALTLTAQTGSWEVAQEWVFAGAAINFKGKGGQSALMQAVSYGQWEFVAGLLKAGADVDTQCDSGHTPLIRATMRNMPECRFQLYVILLDAQASVDTPDNQGKTALIHAAMRGHLDSCNTLISHQASIDAADENKETALFAATRAGHQEVTQLLLSSKAEVNEANNVGRTPLDVSSSDAIVELLRGSGRLNQSSLDQALYRAVDEGDNARVHRLLLAGGNPNWQNPADSEFNCLLRAVAHGDKELAKMLLAANADVSAQDSHGQTAFTWAAHESHWDIFQQIVQTGSHWDDEISKTLSDSARHGVGSITKALVDIGAKPNSVGTSGLPVLAEAASYGHEEVCGVLLGANADANVKTALGESPLMLAARVGGTSDRRVLPSRILLQNNATVDAKDIKGRTALFGAAWRGFVDVVEVLIDAKADVDAHDFDGDSPLMVAATRGDSAMVDLLVNRSADVNMRSPSGYTALDVGQEYDKVSQILRHSGGKHNYELFE